MMFLRRLTDFVLQNRLQAMGIAFILAMIPVVGSVSLVVASLVTLRKNAFEGGLVFIAASLPLLFRLVLPYSPVQPHFIVIMLEVAFFTNVMIWFFSMLL